MRFEALLAQIKKKKKKSEASSCLFGFRYSIPDLLCWVGENWGWFSFREPRVL